MQLPRPTYSSVAATLALVISLSGSAYAAGLVTSADIKDDTVQSRDVRDGALRGLDVQNGTLTLADLNDVSEGQLRGQQGPPGEDAVSTYAQFFATMPADNAATIAAGEDVIFPQDGPSDGSIRRVGPDTFSLPEVGTYRVSFSVPVSESGQLVLTINGADLAYTVVGRATAAMPISGESLVTTTAPSSLLTVRNPSGNSVALTLTPLAGGSRPVSASLIIEGLG